MVLLLVVIPANAGIHYFRKNKNVEAFSNYKIVRSSDFRNEMKKIVSRFKCSDAFIEMF